MNDLDETMELFPMRSGMDEIHPFTTVEIHVFGKGTEVIKFYPENVALKIERGVPHTAQSGLKTIETEMTELYMTGESQLFGQMTLKGGSLVVEDKTRKITGKIIEMEPGKRFPAENYFDVLLEIETQYGVFMNKKPEHMVAQITDIPPDFAKTPYQSTTEINLYLKDDLEGAPIGAILNVQHASND
jgi:hypothetical protein